MTIDETLKRWYSRKRRMGCISATEWFCKRVKGFYPEELGRYTENGEWFGHTVATNGTIRIDLTPQHDRPRKNHNDDVMNNNDDLS